jgi:hypothetical protein
MLFTIYLESEATVTCFTVGMFPLYQFQLAIPALHCLLLNMAESSTRICSSPLELLQTLCATKATVYTGMQGMSAQWMDTGLERTPSNTLDSPHVKVCKLEQNNVY